MVGNPFRRWVGGNAQPEDLSPAVTYDQQSIEKPKGNGRHYEQIHRRNTIRMIAQERLPTLRRRPLLRTIYLAMLVWPTSMPSLSSSPWIRGAPHKGLAMLISRINCWISGGTPGRPRRRLDFQRQNNRKPVRCHRTTVSGRTMASAPRAFGNRWQTQPRTTLSTAKNGTRLGLPRRSTMICCHNTRISASNAARVLGSELPPGPWRGVRQN